MGCNETVFRIVLLREVVIHLFENVRIYRILILDGFDWLFLLHWQFLQRLRLFTLLLLFLDHLLKSVLEVRIEKLFP